ncbi:MAG: porin [Pirellulaceae bacterium]|nr:porin [Pirellulaceae bacterium]
MPGRLAWATPLLVALALPAAGQEPPRGDETLLFDAANADASLPSPSDLPGAVAKPALLPFPATAVVEPTTLSVPDDMSLEEQIAELKTRLGKLEAPPPVKYPANVQVLGVFQADGVTFAQDDANKARSPEGGVGPIENGADFRRARLAAKAALANNMNAFFQMDFAFPGRPTFTDVWVEWTDLPWLGNVRVGQWKQPFSLEVVSSFRYTTFMERSSLFQAFTPFRHLGIGFYNHAQNLNSTWAASYLRTGQDQFGGSISTVGGNGFAGRLTHLLWYDEGEGRDYFHVGGAYFLNSPPRHTIAFRSIPEIFVGQNRSDASTNGTAGFGVPLQFDGTPFFVNTGNLTGVEHVHTFGTEALWVYGPLSLQAEAMAVDVDRSGNPHAFLDGAYVQLGYFLTGEHRPYDRIAGAIDRVKPFEDFFFVRTENGLERGLGAWEVALRFSHIDLNDRNGQVSGGTMDNLTFGINWYCNPYCKVVFNYIHSWRQSPTSPPNTAAVVNPNPPPETISAFPLDSVTSEANAFGIRTQMDF